MSLESEQALERRELLVSDTTVHRLLLDILALLRLLRELKEAAHAR